LGQDTGKIKNFNEKSRSFRGQISEIYFRHMGSNKQADCLVEKALKMQLNMDDCTIEAGRCIQ
jgi:Ser-tRNA(Ala) deacylase AlaX